MSKPHMPASRIGNGKKSVVTDNGDREEGCRHVAIVRVDFKLWPGQGALLENTFRQRVVTALKQLDPNYADWMVVITYRAIDLAGKSVSI